MLFAPLRFRPAEGLPPLWHEVQCKSKIGWIVPGTLAALRIDRRAEVDVVVASLPPGASGAIGWALRVLRNVPYVVEYRDPWTVGAFWAAGADGRPRDDPVTRSRVAVATRLEAALLRLAAGAVIVNGESHVEQLRTRFPDATAGKPVAYIPNGVDLEDVCTEQRPRDQQTLRLLHTGFFYHFHTPHNVISALRLVRRDHPKVLADVELEFMGDGFPPQLRREAEGWGLSDVLRFTPAASYSQALAAMQAADGLLILVPALASDRDRLSTKMYEYLSTDRPVLAVVHPDGATAVLLATVPDALVADNGDEAAIAKGNLTKPHQVYSYLAYVAYEMKKFDIALEAAEKAVADPEGAKDRQAQGLLKGIKDIIKEREAKKEKTKT